MQILRSLSKCSGDRDAVLGLADAELLFRASDLSAEMLVSLADALDTLKKGGWLPSQALLKKARLLDLALKLLARLHTFST